MDADSKKIYPVVFITDENYAMPTAVAITSLFYNRDEKNEYRIYVICADVSEKNIEKLTSLSKERENFFVEIIIRDDYEKFAELSHGTVIHVSKAAIYKFELPNIFPQYDKILYLDGDMLVLKDICSLFDTDIEDRYAAVVKDYKSLSYAKPQLVKLQIDTKHRFYWNSGMMVLNLKKMREDSITEKLYDYKLHGINYFMDQDALNVVFEENVRYVPFYNNLISTVAEGFSEQILTEFYEIEGYSHYTELFKRAVIIHLAGRLKPWQHLIPVLSDLYKFYYSKSPYRAIPLTLLDNDKPDIDTKEMAGKAIPVVYIADRGNAVNTAASIASLLYNKAPETKYELYILCIHVDWEMLRRFRMIEAENVNVHVLHITDYDQINEYDWEGVPLKPVVLAKFQIAKLLPDLDRAIYIPPHTMVLKDLTELYSCNIDGCYCGAVRDCADYADNFSLRVNINVVKYFDTSVLLMDLASMRADEVDKLLVYYKKYGRNKREDSDAYNVVMNGKIAELPYVFNVKDNAADYYAKYKDPLLVAGVKRYASKGELFSRAYIVEIRDKRKPWKEIVPLVSDMFLRYRILSVFHDRLLKNDIDAEIMKLKEDSSYIVCREIDTSDRTFYNEYDKALLPDISGELFDPGTDITLSEEYIMDKYGKTVSKDGFNSEPRDKKIVISLTTIPKRIEAAALVIAIMLHQTVKPDAIVINLGRELFEGVELPELLLTEEKLGVTINMCHDLYCHTKYFHTLQAYPDDIVITVDDDIIYSETLIEELYDSYKRFPDAISAMRVHRMTFNEDLTIAPYVKWNNCTVDYYNKPSHKLLATGVGGVLYPPRLMPEETFNEEALLRLAPKADDLWLKIMQLYNNVPVVNPKYQERLTFIGETQEVGLCYDNVSGGRNDTYLKELLNAYPECLDGVKLTDRITDPADLVPVTMHDKRRPSDVRSERQKLEQERQAAEKKRIDEKKRAEKQRIEAEKHEIYIKNRIRKAVAKALAKDTDERNKKYLAEKKRADKNALAVREIQSSFSYRVGKIITWLPRKIASLFLSH